MKEKGLHEGCIEQMTRLFQDRLYAPSLLLDHEGRIRIDDYEMLPDVQKEVTLLWEKVNTLTLEDCCDVEGYWMTFPYVWFSL